MMETLDYLVLSHKSLKLTQDEMVEQIIEESLFLKLGGDDRKRENNVYKLTLEIHKTLSPTTCSGKSMNKDSDILLMNNIFSDSGYKCDEDKSLKRKKVFSIDLPETVVEYENKELNLPSVEIEDEQIEEQLYWRRN